jgi:hypothetical protein
MIQNVFPYRLTYLSTDIFLYTDDIIYTRVIASLQTSHLKRDTTEQLNKRRRLFLRNGTVLTLLCHEASKSLLGN